MLVRFIVELPRTSEVRKVISVQASGVKMLILGNMHDLVVGTFAADPTLVSIGHEFYCFEVIYVPRGRVMARVGSV